jgi:hypothetical protein
MTELITVDLLNALEAFFKFRTKGETVRFLPHVTYVEIEKDAATQLLENLRKRLQTGGLHRSDVLLLRLLYELSGLYYFENRWMMWGGVPLPSIEEKP